MGIQDFIITSHVKKEKGNENVDEIYAVGDRRELSRKTDLFTGQDIETYNGQVPVVVCGPGYYRPTGSTNMHMITGMIPIESKPKLE